MLSIERLLGNFAGHVQCITALDPERGDSRLRCSPIPDMPMVDIEVQRLGNGHLTYVVNGVQVGNVHGAIGAFSMLCAYFLRKHLNCAADQFDADADGAYSQKMRQKLLATVR
jgi:hypothetical protein